MCQYEPKMYNTDKKELKNEFRCAAGGGDLTINKV
jgi:hypothetical protein